MRYKGNPALAASWFRRGCILQLNKGTILGRMGAASKADGLVASGAGLAHVVASAHSVEHRNGPVPGAGADWPGPVLAVCRDLTGGESPAGFSRRRRLYRRGLNEGSR